MRGGSLDSYHVVCGSVELNYRSVAPRLRYHSQENSRRLRRLMYGTRVLSAHQAVGNRLYQHSSSHSSVGDLSRLWMRDRITLLRFLFALPTTQLTRRLRLRICMRFIILHDSQHYRPGMPALRSGRYAECGENVILVFGVYPYRTSAFHAVHSQLRIE